MTLPRLRLIVRDQTGFTLVELLVAIALVGLLSAGIAGMISQLLTMNARTSNHMIAVRQVQQAGKEISKDALQAQSVEPGADSGFPLFLSWTDLEGVTNNITYTITEDGELHRTLIRSEGAPESRVIARYIVAGNETTCELFSKGIKLTITASVGGGPYEGRETREYKAEARPD